MIAENKFPKVSILIATNRFDNQCYQSIQSCLEVNYTSFEVVLVLNGTDIDTFFANQPEFIKDSRLIVVQTKIKGLSNALNYGLNFCRGEYIARMDSDDICEPNRLKVQSQLLDSKLDINMVCGSALIIDLNGNSCGRMNCKNKTFGILDFVLRNPIIHPSIMVRTEKLKNFGGYVHIDGGAEDYVTWLKIILEKPKSIQGISDVLIKYRKADFDHPRIKRDLIQKRNLLIGQVYAFTKTLNIIWLFAIFYSCLRLVGVIIFPKSVRKKFGKEI